jgi:hypothetical protein
MKLKEYIFDQDIDSIPWLEDLVIEVEYEWKESYLITQANHWEPAEYSEPEIELSEAHLITVNGDSIKLELTKNQIGDLENYIFGNIED